MKNKILAAMAVFALCISCGENIKKVTDNGKPKYLWFDAEANFARFATRDSITYYLDKAVETGFNQIVVDVKPVHGGVLYSSDLMEPLTRMNDTVVERDWDYLGYFLEQARLRNLKVTVSASIFTLGRPIYRDGPAYAPEFDGRTCIEYTPEGLVDIRDDPDKVAVFLNPAMPVNREFALGFLRELISKYDFDGLALDYCRYPGFESDFSDFSRKAFEEFIGEPVKRWPEDIFTYAADGSRVAGKHYKKWWEWRTGIISSFVGEVRGLIDEVKPDVALEYWAASWLNAIYVNGQNWASKRYDPSQEGLEWASPTYKETGFASNLDVFLLGTYLMDVYGLDNPESIEFGIERAKKYIDGDCAMYGTIYAKNHEHNIEDAVYVCLANSEGLMVFDIIQVIEYDNWDDIRKGIERAEKSKR